MRRATRNRLLLILVSVALLSAAVLQWQHDRAQVPGPLLAIEPAAISHITLKMGDTPAEHYLKRDGHWWRTDGQTVRSDDGRLGELADIAAAPVLSWRPLSDFDPARIGLAPPAIVLVLDGHALAFGETSVTGPQRYVQVGDRVALVSDRFTPRAPPDHTVQAP